MTPPNFTPQAADVALDPMAGTLAEFRNIESSGPASDSCARAQVADPWARDAAQTSMVKPESRANAGSTVAPSVGPAAYTLTLPYPISANRYWASRTVTPRGGKSFTTTYVTPEAKAYKAQVQKLALVAGVRKPIAGRVRVEFTLYPNRPQDWQKRMRKEGAAWDDTVQCLDLDNAQKVVLDSLKDVVFQDDAWVREIHARRAEPDEFGARLMVVVTPLAIERPQTDLFGVVDQERKS